MLTLQSLLLPFFFWCVFSLSLANVVYMYITQFSAVFSDFISDFFFSCFLILFENYKTLLQLNIRKLRNCFEFNICKIREAPMAFFVVYL